MRAIASRCVRGNLVGFLSRGGIPPGLVGFLSPSIIGALWRVMTPVEWGGRGVRARYLAVLGQAVPVEYHRSQTVSDQSRFSNPIARVTSDGRSP